MRSITRKPRVVILDRDRSRVLSRPQSRDMSIWILWILGRIYQILLGFMNSMSILLGFYGF